MHSWTLRITGLRNVVWPPDLANSSSGRTSRPGELFPNPQSSGTDGCCCCRRGKLTTKTGADGACPVECMAGVTLAPRRTWDRTTDENNLRPSPHNGTPQSRPCAHSCCRAKRPFGALCGVFPWGQAATESGVRKVTGALASVSLVFSATMSRAAESEKGNSHCLSPLFSTLTRLGQWVSREEVSLLEPALRQRTSGTLEVGSF